MMQIQVLKKIREICSIIHNYRCSSCFLKYLGLVNFGIDEVRRDSDLRVTLTCDQHTHL